MNEVEIMENKNPGEWRLFMQYINGEPMYIVGRQRDMNTVLHSGNIEYRGKYTKREEAEKLRQQLLRGEAE